MSLAGLDARNVFHSEEDLFHNIEIVWMKKGKQPTRADMNNKALSVTPDGRKTEHFSGAAVLRANRYQSMAVWACPRGAKPGAKRFSDFVPFSIPQVSNFGFSIKTDYFKWL